MLKIALVILYADPARGGAERYTADLAKALARRGHGVSLVALQNTGGAGGVRRIELPVRAATRARRYGWFLDRLDDHLEAERYDIVHAMLPVHRCDIYQPHAGMAAAGAAKWNAAFNPRRRAMAAVEKRLLSRSPPPVVIALSEYVRRAILRWYPDLAAARLATLLNAVDLDRFTPPEGDGGAADGASSRPVAGLMIAQNFALKGLREAIAAVARVNESSGRRLVLNVVGRDRPGPYRRLATRQAVVFHGPVEDPRPFYRHADFFVLPTKHDSCSLVVLEALAMGLPVISTIDNGATEVMTDGVHGRVLEDPADVEALAEAMRELMDPERRRAMRRACLALRPRLSYAHHLDELLGIYATARE